ncbi:MAG: hypothetical protein R2749_02450 [Acidimicrobiales bacterium]
MPFILAAERLMESGLPRQWIRTMLFELSRIANVALFWVTWRCGSGAVTPVFYPSVTASTC